MVKPAVSICAVVACLCACTPPEPIRIGYVATLSGRSADLGMAGRNGTLLAVEEINAAGGVNGRPLELLVRDDEQNDETGTRAVEALAAEKVVAIVGPMTSSMAFALAPVVTRLEVPLVSPTATANELLDRDDMLFRLSSPTSDHAKLDASFQFQVQGRRRLAVAYEVGNPIYTKGYLKEFTAAFTAQGGELVRQIAFDSAQDTDLAAIVRDLAAGRPDGFLFIANALDSARLAQHARRQLPTMPLIGVAWAGTEEFAELGGKAVEGMWVGQYFNRDDQSPAYLAFKESFEKRFRELPGFGSAAAFDAVHVIATALRKQTGQQTLKDALLKDGPYTGLQQPIRFNATGDALRPSQVAVVRGGRLVAQPWP